MSERCGTSKAPSGWYCTRDAGHGGPCAAFPEPEIVEMIDPTDGGVLTVSLSAVIPDRWDGELTEDKLREIVSGLLIPNAAMSRRLAAELLKLKG